MFHTDLSLSIRGTASAGVLLACCLACIWAPAWAETKLAHVAIPPIAVAVNGLLPAPAAGVTDLKFRDMFKMPVGPKGLEATPALRELNGKHVRLVGFMASQETSVPGMLILTPMPVNMGDEDESLSDDLPGNAVFVHLARVHAHKAVPNLQGLLQLVGTLTIGAHDEVDGHVSSLQLELDERTSKLLTTQAPAAHKGPHKANPHGSKQLAQASR